MEDFFAAAATLVGVVVLTVGLVLLFTWPTQLLWNWLMPTIFGLKQITLMQAFGLELLSLCLIRNTK